MLVHYLLLVEYVSTQNLSMKYPQLLGCVKPGLITSHLKVYCWPIYISLCGCKLLKKWIIFDDIKHFIFLWMDRHPV